MGSVVDGEFVFDVGGEGLERWLVAVLWIFVGPWTGEWKERGGECTLGSNLGFWGFMLGMIFGCVRKSFLIDLDMRNLVESSPLCIFDDAGLSRCPLFCFCGLIVYVGMNESCFCLLLSGVLNTV